MASAVSVCHSLLRTTEFPEIYKRAVECDHQVCAWRRTLMGGTIGSRRSSEPWSTCLSWAQ
eukprot:5815517-Amphidinium_carterae.1